MFDSAPFKPTPKQRANLEKLAAYLATGKMRHHFDMRVLLADKGDIGLDPNQWECGAVGCALGHGPVIGIKPLRGEGWRDYSYRQFGIRRWYEDKTDVPWHWCFAGIWGDVKLLIKLGVSRENAELMGTPQHAAGRIRYLLEHNTGILADQPILMAKSPDAEHICYLIWKEESANEG